VIVVDANVIAYLWIECEHTRLAEKVLSRDPDWVAPLLWRSELRSALSGQLRAGNLSLDHCFAVLDQASEQMSGREYLPSSQEVMRLVQGSRASAYDCEYVALARDLGVPLVTNDARLARGFPENVRSMAGFLRAR
jgi:predicted nucleic acid-binding protein